MLTLQKLYYMTYVLDQKRLPAFAFRNPKALKNEEHIHTTRPGHPGGSVFNVCLQHLFATFKLCQHLFGLFGAYNKYILLVVIVSSSVP